MEDPASVTRMRMETKKGPAVPHTAGAGTLMNTANVLDAPTSGNLKKVVVLVASNRSKTNYMYRARLKSGPQVW